MSKRRGIWGKEDLAAALNAIESGTSQRDAAKAFNIPRRTLQNYVQSGKTFKNLGRSSVLTRVAIRPVFRPWSRCPAQFTTLSRNF